MACKISGKIEATTFFVVAFDMQKAKKSPARGGASNYLDAFLRIPAMKSLSLLSKSASSILMIMSL